MTDDLPVPDREAVSSWWTGLIEGRLTRETVHNWAAQWVESETASMDDTMVMTALQHLHGFGLERNSTRPSLTSHSGHGSRVHSDQHIAEQFTRWTRACGHYDADPEEYSRQRREEGRALELRERLARLLADQTPACGPARAALLSGGDALLWDGAGPAAPTARIYEVRLEHTRANGIDTVGLAETVEILRRHEDRLRMGRIITSDGSWVFFLFLTADGRTLVACTGVRQQQR